MTLEAFSNLNDSIILEREVKLVLDMRTYLLEDLCHAEATEHLLMP